MAETPYTQVPATNSISLLTLLKVINSPDNKEFFTRFANVINLVETEANLASPELVISLILSMSKGELVQEYTFDASAKTITFTSFSEIDIRRVLLVTNLTDNIIIYNFSDDTKGGTAATNVLTMDYNTTSMDDADEIQVLYDYPKLLQLIDEASATITYIGKAQTGTGIGDAFWQIERIDTGSGTAIEWAEGTDKFDKVWDDRAAYTYS